MLKLIKPTYKELLKEINELSTEQDLNSSFKFFNRELIFINSFIPIEGYTIKEEDINNYFRFLLMKNNCFDTIIQTVNLDEIVQYWNEIIYEIKIHNLLGDNITKIIKLFFLFSNFRNQNIGNKNKHLVPSYRDYTFEETEKARVGIFSNNKECLKNENICLNYINEYIDEFLIKDKPRKKQRSILTKSIKLEVFKRDNFKCVYCGSGKENVLEIDHIKPISRGGTDELDNLQTLCKSCNLSKSNRIIK